MRCPVPVKTTRNVLCVFPAYTPAFATFAYSYRLMGRVRAFMPPQGLLLIANYMPESWAVRFVDENIARATDADFAWADVVFVSGMHIQAGQINDIRARAHAAGKVTALGGPSVSASPELYPEFDYLHMGELGDATDALITRLDETIARADKQVVFKTQDRLPMFDFPLPAFQLVPLDRYLIGSLQFSSGCPYQCEFCDIPALYGRQPRLKSPEQLCAELDAIVARKAYSPSIYFVDDNFIGNRKATKEMLPHLIAWQRKNGYPLVFACEATLNIAKQPEILKLMREANFEAVFVGIETPELDALKAMRKGHNAVLPMFEAIETLNRYGLEVASGIIIGLDTDSDRTEEHLKAFVDRSQIPMLTMNLLQALPKTALWDRLDKAGRIVDDTGLDSNVRFLRPYDEVVGTWRRCIAYAYEPERLFARYAHQIDTTYANRLKFPIRGRLNWNNLRQMMHLTLNIITQIGFRSNYWRPFWRTSWKAIKRGQIDAVFRMGFLSHHLIEFTRDAVQGVENASFYSARVRQSPEQHRATRDLAPLRKAG